MKILSFDIGINVPVEQVYQTMLDKETFKKWTSVFSPTSRFEGNWNKGSEILFLADEDDGKVCGMISQINENKTNEFVSIEHIGILEDGEKILEGKKVEGFAGAKEEYTYLRTQNGTLLQITMDSTLEWEDYLRTTWPKALAKLKEICENAP